MTIVWANVRISIIINHLTMSFRKTVSWIFLPFTMWYAVGVWFRNLMFNIGLKKQVAPDVTTIGVGNICVGGSGKTPHVEYLIRLLQDDYRVAVLSRGYKRKSSGFVLDDGTHNVAQLGDEPAMIASKYPKVKVAVCEKRVLGVQKLMAMDQPPQVILLDDSFQHRYIKPTINLLLTSYNKPYYQDSIMPYGDLREGRSARFRANIIIVTGTPANLNPIEKHNIVNQLDLQPYQKVFFSTVKYLDPMPLMGGQRLPLSTVESALVLTGIANPDAMIKYVSEHCAVEQMVFADHHQFTSGDIKHINRAFSQMPGDRKVIITTEKDAVRMRPMVEKGLLEGLPIYYLPIEVSLDNRPNMDFDQSVKGLVNSNILFVNKMKTTKFEW